jgi:DNA (cytosine-5)-methyltransferase 1
MSAYYNEIDPYAAQWLRNLIAAGHIAPGIVDERSIEDVRPDELMGYTQCHFFAGIGIWSLALREAGISDDTRVWTGSCPCQPVSAAGAGEGFADERHLWPAFFNLIEQCGPAIVLGEQVASKDAEPWIDLVCADLGSLGYATGAIAFPAASVGAPHIRDRLYWLANAERERDRREAESSDHRQQEADGSADRAGGCGGAPRSVANAPGQGPQGSGHGRSARPGRQGPAAERGGQDGGMADTSSGGFARFAGHWQAGVAERGEADGMADADGIGRIEGRAGEPAPECDGPTGDSGLVPRSMPGPVNGLWRAADWLYCRDGLWRPVESGTFPLAHGDPTRVGRLRAYGNAINAEVAAGFLRAYREAR